LILRIRDRGAFEHLARDGTRIRRSALWCTWCPDPDSTHASVAFAISRAYGPAVDRNRLRRRIRAILREIDNQSPLPPNLMLMGARPTAIELTFDQLKSTVSSMIEEMRNISGPTKPARSASNV
jgi:ribonuclease P protein component